MTTDSSTNGLLVQLEPESVRAGRTAPIVVIGRQRSGTTVFRELLVGAGAFDAGEIFHREFANNSRRFFWKVRCLAAENPTAIHPTEYPRIFRLFLDEVHTLAAGKRPAIDIKYNALRIVDAGMSEGVPSAIRICAEHGARFVHLRRQNLLRVQVSLAVAQVTGRWRETRDGGPMPISDRRISLEPNSTLARVASDEALANSVSGWLDGLPHDTLTYETLFAPNGEFSTATLDVVRALTKSDRVASSPALRQQNPEQLEDLVANFADLSRVFAGTRYEWMLHR
jgi:LPS sulfotransferase NodH